MYVCICNGITDKQVRRAAESGVTSLWDLQKELGVASNCGKCGDTAVEILRETHNAKRAEPVVYVPASA
jgi:bacterioferritin-associated ferredoxin